MPCVGSQAYVAMPKILSHDRLCVFCTFMQPICLTLPRAFFRVMNPWKHQIFLRWVTLAHPGWVRSCRAMCGCLGHVAMPKILSHHHLCVFYTFTWLIFLTLPCAFVQVVDPWKPQILFRWVGSHRVWVPMQTLLGELGRFA